MSDLISRGRARHEFAKFFQDSKSLVDDCDSLLCMLPTIDAVVHGRQIPTYHKYYNRDGEWMIADEWHCSECGVRHYERWNHCPNCGAKMDGDANV